MIGKEKVLAIIPARGGSKGVPRKNVRIVGGKPLIAWTVASALAAKTVDRTILSSDDPEIMTAAQDWGCEIPFTRPPNLATDTASMLDVVHHAVENCGGGFEWVVLLQPTSPLRSPDDIDATIYACVQANAPAAVTVTPSDKSPFWMYFRGESGLMKPVLDDPRTLSYRRQDLPSAYALNGAVYVARRDWLKGRSSFVSPETICHIMPRDRSIDIDTEFDLSMLEAYLSVRKNAAV
ncbi:acylneuraminate cytidylyltransferase family protein [Ferrovibrio terrae]|uniref:acylneuraminate cytidylyltransferase family protein n=1 Tax=Ferrovibrio terrae TaxID=2594003 RepID=UPI0031381AA4